MARVASKLTDRKRVAESTKCFFFEKPDGFTYEAGQYVTIELPEAGDDSSHTFTLASAPHEERLMIATRVRDSKFKQSLAEMSPGAEIALLGPKGDFTMPADQEITAVFLAGGIGITPFRSMLQQTRHEDRSDRITVLYSNRRPEDAAFLVELEDLEQSQANVRLVNTMTSMEESDREWTGETCHIDAEFIERHVDELDTAVFYVAGPPDMVDDMEDVLREAEIDDDRIISEQFAGY